MASPRRRSLLPLLLCAVRGGEEPGNLSRSPVTDRAFGGDPRCWARHAVAEVLSAHFPWLQETPWLLRDVCCGEGREGICWRGSYTFERCCAERRSAESHAKSCWSSPAVHRLCCGSAGNHALCGLGAAGAGREETLFRECCALPTPPEFAPATFPAGCHARMWREESFIYTVMKAKEVPALRVADLGWLAEHFYATGDALPSLLVLVEALVRRRGDALEMCAPAALLAHLLDLERSMYSTGLQVVRAKLKQLKLMWHQIASPGLTEEGNLSAPLPSAVTHGGEQTLLQAVRTGFRRLDAQVAEIDQAVRSRKRTGFEAQILLPVCWPGELSHFQVLLREVFHPGLLQKTGTLYLYDVCYALFPAGSSVYDLRNVEEVEIMGSEGHVSFSTSPPHLWPKDPLPEAVVEMARRFRRTVLVPFHEEVPMGMVSVVMRHLAVHYERLPDLLFCIHPDMYEHVQLDALDTVLRSVALQQYPPNVHFLPMGHRHTGPVDDSGRVGTEVRSYCAERKGTSDGRWSSFRGGSHLKRISKRAPTGAYCQWLELAWELLFEKPMRLPQDDFGGYDFGQSVVTREAVQQRPKAFWQRAWRALCSRSNFQLLPGTSFVSTAVEFVGTVGAFFPTDWSGYHKAMECVFEHMWTVLFNPKAKSWLWPTRLRDPSLPLAFKFNVMHNPSVLRQYRWTPHKPL
eukprot:TRINITY_DN62520_c0_g1_i1.p1 TRINITY_DN62520_c0_g1~~TRINITY_DN62520_c0_g1_i1.p1  ORF type:complete len:688 (+),score=119.25 TRINITY_DN62520_c0_g1_i1:73-2136(+)